MRVATLGGISGAIKQAVPLRTNGVGAFIEAVVPLTPSLRGLGHVPGNTVSELRDYLEVIVERTVHLSGQRRLELDKRYNDLRMALVDILETQGNVRPPTALRSAVASYDNSVYMAIGQWYRVPWLWGVVVGTLAVGLGAWWWLR